MENAEVVVHITIRLPEKLHKKIRHLSQDERRSLNSEIVYLLEQATKESV